MANTPSYITLRKGIYYFQIRIPANVTHSKLPSNRLIRKSTKTGNRREAMRIARQWWVQVMTNDFFKRNYPELAEAEQNDDIHKSLVDRGRILLEEFRKSGIDENDHYAVEDFEQHLTTNDLRALYTAKEYLKSIQAPKVESNPVTPQVDLFSPSPNRTKSFLSLMDIVEKWIHYNTEVRSEGKRWSKSSIKKFVPQVKVMVEMVDNPLAPQFTKDLLRDEFCEKLPLLLTSLRQRDLFKQFDELGNKTDTLKPFDEIYELADEHEIKRIASRTLQDYAKNITMFLKWAGKKGYIPSNMETVLADLLEIAGEDNRRKAFNEHDLKKLFETEEYRSGLLFKHPYRHWIPLISLYIGCRLGEASQLYVENIQEDEKTGIWYFEFTDGENQTLKSKASKRKVPIHRDLIELGFLKYLEQQKNKGEKQLFSHLSPDASGHWGSHLGRWFNGESRGAGLSRRKGYKEKCAVVTNKERVSTFHSFRHYVVNRSKQESVKGKDPQWDYEVWCEITGHSSGKQTVRQQVYEQEYDLITKANEMKKMKLDFLDIDGIRRWR